MWIEDGWINVVESAMSVEVPNSFMPSPENTPSSIDLYKSECVPLEVTK